LSRIVWESDAARWRLVVELETELSEIVPTYFRTRPHWLEQMRGVASVRRVLGVVALLLALVGGWLWFRSSGLVAVSHVTVVGATGPDAGQIDAALTRAARNMTTLDVRMSELRTAIAPYPIVKDVRVSTQFPHGIRIRVIDETAVGAVTVNGSSIAVAGDGVLLHDVSARSLPAIPVRVPPGGTRLSDPSALAALAVLAAAPPRMLSHVSDVTMTQEHGLVAQIKDGPSLYFGGATELALKWQAADAVLADPGSVGALYIDVTDPARPAAGAGMAALIAAGEEPNPAAAPSGSASSSSSSGSSRNNSSTSQTSQTSQNSQNSANTTSTSTSTSTSTTTTGQDTTGPPGTPTLASTATTPASTTAAGGTSTPTTTTSADSTGSVASTTTVQDATTTSQDTPSQGAPTTTGNTP
jgi:cell division protein FtsQ